MKGNIALVFKKLQEKHITKPDQAVDRSAIAQATGLGEQQVSTCVHALVKRKVFGRVELPRKEGHEGGVRFGYWLMREPNGKKRRKNGHKVRVVRTKRGPDYKVSITGPDLIVEKQINGETLSAVLQDLLK